MGGFLVSAAPLLVCTPAGREGERDKNVISFHRTDFQERGTRGGVLGVFLPAPAALLACIPMGREAERAEHLVYLSFCRSNFPDRRQGVEIEADLYNLRRFFW